MLNKIKQLFLRENRITEYAAGILTVLLLIVALNSFWDLLARLGWVSPIAQDIKTITVNAEGEVTVTPDTAKISISVVTDGKTADAVQKNNTENMNKVIDYVKGLGVEAKDIKTTYYNLYPRYDYVNGRQVPAGFSASQSAEIKVRDLKKVGEIVTGTVARGANQVQGIDFFVDEPEKFKAEARKMAFDKAKIKAKEMAKLAGVRLGRVATFSESYNGQPPIFYEKAYGIGAGIGGGGVPDIQSGSQEVAVNVSVVFEIR
ncbi:MAG: SIMPL domain-containing protein [bacterium]|nr:SIMPL domain-containing protein [bacterium]